MATLFLLPIAWVVSWSAYAVPAALDAALPLLARFRHQRRVPLPDRPPPPVFRTAEERRRDLVNEMAARDGY